MAQRSSRTLPAFAILSMIVLLSARAAPASTTQAGSPDLELRAALLPFFGLDRLARGGGIEAGLGFRDSFCLPGAALRLHQDLSLGTWICEALLSLDLGPGLELHLGQVIPLGQSSADAGNGRRLGLEPVDPPSLFGIDARLISLPVGTKGLRLEARAVFDYRAWRLASARVAGSPTDFRKDDPLSAFSLGFTAGLAARLAWAPGAKRAR